MPRQGKPFMDLVSKECPAGLLACLQGESPSTYGPRTLEHTTLGRRLRRASRPSSGTSGAARRKHSAFAEFDAKWRADPDTLPCLRSRISFRDVSRATDTPHDSGSTRATLRIPSSHCPILRLASRNGERPCTYLLGVLSSLPLDWYARRFVVKHVSFFVINPFPIPRRGGESPTPGSGCHRSRWKASGTRWPLLWMGRKDRRRVRPP